MSSLGDFKVLRESLQLRDHFHHMNHAYPRKLFRLAKDKSLRIFMATTCVLVFKKELRIFVPHQMSSSMKATSMKGFHTHHPRQTKLLWRRITIVLVHWINGFACPITLSSSLMTVACELHDCSFPDPSAMNDRPPRNDTAAATKNTFCHCPRVG